MHTCANSNLVSEDIILIPVLPIHTPHLLLLMSTCHFPSLWLTILCDIALPFSTVLLTQNPLFQERCVALTCVVKIIAVHSWVKRLCSTSPPLASVQDSVVKVQWSQCSRLDVCGAWGSGGIFCPHSWNQLTQGSSASLSRSGSHTQQKVPTSLCPPQHFPASVLLLK